MKKLTAVLLAALLLAALPACSKKEEGTTETDAVAFENDGIQYDIGALSDETEGFDYMNTELTQYVRIGETHGLTVNKGSDKVTDEEFDNEIAALLDSYSYSIEVTDRAVQEGDTVRADYTGYMDGEAFEGGTGYDQTITAASGTGYIEGFAEAFIGQMPGEEFSFDVTFPENYGYEPLNGQEVTFVCTVHAIVTDEVYVPELNDDFVAENFDYSTVDEFLVSYRQVVEKRKTAYVESQMYTDLWMQILDSSEVIAYPEEAVNNIYESNKAFYESYADYYGTDYDTFLSAYMGMTDDDLREEAESYVKEDLVMYQLIKDYSVSLSDEDYRNGMNELAESNGMTLDEMVDYYGEETLRTSVLWQEMMKAVASDAVITSEVTE